MNKPDICSIQFCSKFCQLHFCQILLKLGFHFTLLSWKSLGWTYFETQCTV